MLDKHMQAYDEVLPPGCPPGWDPAIFRGSHLSNITCLMQVFLK